MKVAIESVLNDVAEEDADGQQIDEPSLKKSKKKKPKGEIEDGEPMALDEPNLVADTEPETEKKKKRQKSEEQQENAVPSELNGHDAEQNGTSKKKKKQSHKPDNDVEAKDLTQEKKKKKKKSKSQDE
ncbi:uncharacterized protein LOC141818738 [Curcuma longa]|uniref:uncharacterized protein LOC141818738 n=1 Tax=Curcuma longa TaxID=136217 RepID=UPI003D9E8A73